IALRRALGASRFRLIRQFFAQGLVLSAIGCAAGIAIASIGADVAPIYLRQLFGAMPATLGDGVSWPAIVVAAAIALAVASVFGVLMVFGTRAADAAASSSALHVGGRAGATRRGSAALRSGIIAVQI